jgi:hypothetical protein
VSGMHQQVCEYVLVDCLAPVTVAHRAFQPCPARLQCCCVYVWWTDR